MTLNLLIVEDEDLTRDCLLNYIPWKEIGISEIKTAKNGEHALEVIEEYKPDILLSDVRMPKMDGIELSKRVKNIYPECKIVFISGYADKEYLLSAIQLNALNYIEKPINIDEITETMKKVVEICINQMKREQITNKIFEMFNENLWLIHKTVIFELLKPDVDINTLDKYGFDLNKKYIPIVAFLSSDDNGNNEVLIKNNEELIEKIIDNKIIMPFDFYVAFSEYNQLIFVINYYINPEIVLDILKQNLKESYKNIDITVGIGKTINDITKSGEIIKELILFLKVKQFYNGKNKTYYFEDISQNHKIEDVDNRIHDFEELLKNNQFEQAKKIVNDLSILCNERKYKDIEKVKGIYLEFLFKIYEVGRERGLTIKLEKKERSHTWKVIDRIPTLSELDQYICLTIDEIFNIFKNRGKLDKKVYQIISYINDNFSDKELSIMKIANYFYFSPNYLCNIFKKATGKTINDYITEVRIEKAKAFLKDRSIKLYEVAEMVGFGDPNYFSSIFKKKVGVTPSVFKERFYYD
ncbi:response regulator [Caldicellulosiruptoraceae bacterium PP1]